MVNPYGYPAEKYADAVSSLAEGDSGLRARIEEAAMHIMRLQDRDFPDPELLTRHNMIMTRLTRVADPNGNSREGWIRAALGLMDTEEARKIAAEILNLEREIRARFLRAKV